MQPHNGHAANSARLLALVEEVIGYGRGNGRWAPRVHDISRLRADEPTDCCAASNPPRVVGVLMGLEKDDSEAHARAEAFERGLRREGWSVRENLRIEYRFTGGDFGRMQAFVTELVTLKPDCILGHTTPIVRALKRLPRLFR